MTDIVDRLRAMQGMGDIQLKALMDGVGPQAAHEIESLRSEIAVLRKESDRFEDGIDWIQRALQAEANIEAAVQAEREACAKVCEEIEDEYRERESLRYAELRTDAQTGASDCALRIRARGDT